MKYNPVSIRVFASTAAVLAMLSVGYIPQVHAEENVNGSVGRETSRPPITAESLEAYTLCDAKQNLLPVRPECPEP